MSCAWCLVQSDKNPVIPLRATFTRMPKGLESMDSFEDRDSCVFKVNPGLLTSDVTSTHSLMQGLCASLV